jgi:hypothetical protein
VDAVGLAIELEANIVKSGKQLVFRYNGDSKTDEVEVDAFGDVPIPPENSFVTRKGRRWKVIKVDEERAVNDSKMFPVYRLYLTDKF